MICVNSEFVFMGFAIKLTISAMSSDICEKIKQIFMSKFEEFREGFKELIKGSGGCIIESEQPLKIATANKVLEILVEPASLFTRMYWRDVSNRVKLVLCEP